MVSEQVGPSIQIFDMLIVSSMRVVYVYCRCIISSIVCLMVCRMAGRNDCVIAEALDYWLKHYRVSRIRQVMSSVDWGNFRGIICQHSRVGMIWRVLKYGSEKSRILS